jgi:isopentenyl diphosphate isomerase/L-lactate dehydrogenase-like FMN-dependent dehydrogenase
MQLGATPDRGLMAEVVHRAAAAGATALCLKVDLPVFPWWPKVMVDGRRALELNPFIVGETRTIWHESCAPRGAAENGGLGPCGLRTHPSTLAGLTLNGFAI